MTARTASAALVLLLTSGAALAGADRTLERELLGAAASQPGATTGGHDGKFFLASADDAFRLNIRGQTQFRYNLTFRDVESPDEELTNGFTMRRARLEFSGYVFSDWEYKIVGGFGRSDGAFDLEDAILSREFDNGLTLTWGQFKLPFLREESISSKYQLAADRSVANEVFNQDRSQAVQLAYEGEGNFRVVGAVSDGFSADNTSYHSPAEADFALTGRAELKVGDAPWKTYEDFTSFREGDTGALIGAALHWEAFGDTGNTDTFAGTPATGMDMFSYTIDASYEGGGWNVFGAFVGRSIDPDGGDSLNDLGAVAQGGVFLTELTELFARWDAVFPDDDRAAGEDFHTITAGLNHYFIPGSHAAKFTADVQWFLDSQGESADVVSVNEGIGLAPSDGDDQFTIRLQMQLLF